MSAVAQPDELRQLEDPKVTRRALSRLRDGVARNPELPQLMARCFAVATPLERAEIEAMARRQCEIFEALAARAGVADRIAKLNGAAQ